MFPICELLSDLTFKDSFSDLIGPGAVIGELGYLKEECRSSAVTCETFLTAYFFSSAALAQASHACTVSSPSEDFSLHLWACWGSRVASSLCQYLPKFQVVYLAICWINGFNVSVVFSRTGAKPGLKVTWKEVSFYR